MISPGLCENATHDSLSFLEGYTYLDCADRVLFVFGVGVRYSARGLLGVFALRLRVLGLNVVWFVLELIAVCFLVLSFLFFGGALSGSSSESQLVSGMTSEAFEDCFSLGRSTSSSAEPFKIEDVTMGLVETADLQMQALSSPQPSKSYS